MIADILIFLAWGSHLNSLAYRLLHLTTFFKLRSFCPQCNHIIAWYDNIPLVSWLYLAGRCRNCRQPISWLYPFIEVVTTLTLYLLQQLIVPQYFFIYFLFFSALIITIRTDFESMLISRFVTSYLLPLVYIAAYFKIVPITLITSLLGTCFGYILLLIPQMIHFSIKKEMGLGQGDLELLAFIGAFTGPFGCWIALSIGSIIGTCITLCWMLITQKNIIKIPFGAYLAFGSIIFTLYQNYFYMLFFA